MMTTLAHVRPSALFTHHALLLDPSRLSWKQGMADDPAALARSGECDGRKMLQLLRSCSGAFRPGVLTALVGSSGAGKTTLMDCLAGRTTSEADTSKSIIKCSPDKHSMFCEAIRSVAPCSGRHEGRRAGVGPPEGAGDICAHHGLRGAVRRPLPKRAPLGLASMSHDVALLDGIAPGTADCT